MKSLENKIVAITGAGGGIGKVAAQMFTKEGAHVLILELNKEAGESATEEIKKSEAKQSYTLLIFLMKGQ